MTLDDIPADKILELTVELDRLFKAAGCEPACHVCLRKIDLGEQFQLLSFEGTDEMLCVSCDRDKLARKKWMIAYPDPGNRPRYEGGYSRPPLPRGS